MPTKANMKNKKLLFSAPSAFFSDDLKALFENNFQVEWGYGWPKKKMLEALQDKEIWITSTAPGFMIDAGLIQQAVKLKWIATPSTGTTHLDVNSLLKSGRIVCSIKEAAFLKDIYASSEHTFGLLLAMVRNTIPSVRGVLYHNRWREEETSLRGEELWGKTIGIVGYGRIGSNLARYCRTFGMEINAYDPYKNIDENGVHQVSSLQQLLERSDIVSLNYHLNQDNRNGFGAGEFAQMKTGAYFLNTARGELVDELALIDALNSGKLRAAALDVIQNESSIDFETNPLILYARKNGNLLITSHIAGLTVQSESKAAKEIYWELTKSIAQYSDL